MIYHARNKVHYGVGGGFIRPEKDSLRSDILNSVRKLFKKIWAYSLARNIDIDSKEAVAIHKCIIKRKPLLTKHYAVIYQYFKKIEDSLSHLDFPSLEIGSGGGFLKEFLPAVITSDVIEAEGIDRIENAVSFSFPDNSLKAVYCNGVLHHIENPGKCIEEIQRILVPNGVFVCCEPSSALFGYFMNKYFHDEYTNKYVKEWEIKKTDNRRRLSEANMALPYIMFKRDINLFRKEFPYLKIRSIAYCDFLRSTLSGGLSYRPFIPRILYKAVDFIEMISKPLMPVLGMDMIVVIQKTEKAEL